MTPQPRARHRRPRFGLFPVRSPLLRESRLLSFPGATEMFQFAPFASAAYNPHKAELQMRMIPLSRNRVAPFGDPGI